MTDDVKAAISKWSSYLLIDPDLIAAFCMQESSMNTDAIRFEPNWRYFNFPDEHAKDLKITGITEQRLQMFSYGPMQIMGSVARELGFLGPLTKLLVPDIGIQYGALKVKSLLAKYQQLSDVAAAYNAGTPVKIGDKYKNQDYVSSVLMYYERKLYTREGENL